LLPPIQDLPIAALGASLALLVALLCLESPLLDGVARLGGGRQFQNPGGAVRLASVVLAAGRRRAAWAAGAIGVAVALAVAVSTMVDSFRATVVDWTEQSIRSDVWIRPVSAATGVAVGRLDPRIVEIAQDLFGDDAVDPFHTEEARFRGQTVTVAGAALDVVRDHGNMPFRDGRSAHEVYDEVLKTNGAVVNEPFANRFGIERGDTIQLRMAGEEVTLPVEGVFYDYSRHQGLVVINRKKFLEFYPNDGPNGVAIFLPEGADAEAAREQLREALGGRWLVDVLLNRESRAEIMAIFDRTFAITTALQSVAAVVAVIAVLTVLFALVSERRHDLALLHALGGSRGQITRVVVAEAGLLGLTGAAGGLLVGLIIGVVLVKIVNLQSFGWTLRFLPPWTTLAWVAGGVVIACLAAGWIPGYAAARMPPQEALREDQ
jgi:putative ABC transport system permease protein